jgi:basic amino acid/polyamine antiporter, APA family
MPVEGDAVTAGTRRVKSVEDSIRDTDEPEHRLKKSLSGLDLTVFGVGVIIGAGIFVVTGVVAQTQSGPAVGLSFVIAGITCGLAALCYAEFASTVAPPTRSPTPRSVSSSPGSSAGT